MPNQQLSGIDGPSAPADALSRSSHEEFDHSQIAESPPSIPDYQVLERIGGGAYGEVWLARNILGEFRAVKVIYRNRFTDPRPFEREFEGIRRFEPISRSHPSQLAILHVGKNDSEGCFYYVMELADNATTDREMPGAGLIYAREEQVSKNYIPHTLRWDIEQHGRLPASECVQIGFSLAKALAHLHEQGLVHRDIKPSNVVFVNRTAKLGDIGLVTEVGDTQSIVGTEGYIPPEGPGKPQADIFSLGKVLYEISTGMDRRRFAELPPDLQAWPDRKEIVEFNEILLRACTKDPAQRYQTAKEMLDDLQSLRSGASLCQKRRRLKAWRLVCRAAMFSILAAAVGGTILLASRFQRSGSASSRERISTNELANQFYRLGRTKIDRGASGTNYQAAADYFKRATQADPRFAPAWAYRAVMYQMPGWQFLPKAKVCALKALELDDRLAIPHFVLGWYNAMHEWAWTDAEHEYQRAISLNPLEPLPHRSYGEFLRMLGRTDEALEQLKKAEELLPRTGWINMRRIGFLISARKFNDAIAQADIAIQMDPEGSGAYGMKGIALSGAGRYQEAMDTEVKERLLHGEARDSVEQDLAEFHRAVAVEGLKKAFWRTSLHNVKQWKQGPFWEARSYAQLGQKDEALACLEASFKQREGLLTFHVMTDFTLDPIRSEPRFHAILKGMHLE
jgi:serine/threonine protein kinase